jgi:TrpR-related protein YerC/YecD
MYNLTSKLSRGQQEELFIKLARSLAALPTAQESAELLKDLLSESEALMLARRLQIAELLIGGETYATIREETKASPGTISRVQTWLGLYGEGYRTVVKRMKHDQSESHKEVTLSFADAKRKYPMYFWPQLLLEELVKTANAREKARLKKVISQMKEKTQLSRQLNKLLE